MNIGKTIKQLRQSANYSQIELSSIAGITQTSLSQIELGKKRPTQQTLDKICQALNINESILYIMSTSIDDIPEENRNAYQDLFPKVKDMLEAMFIVK
ncbi:helix-turn-helix domain-containing protein [Sphingobacterium corticis]|uniref:Helix-turn-helix domain-containing protein n=1 Tax=Sphingobacterium corticis TaxID=1812823 RepID=A0ABW5NGD3_9SPHI